MAVAVAVVVVLLLLRMGGWLDVYRG